jgi:hypothetical protein
MTGWRQIDLVLGCCWTDEPIRGIERTVGEIPGYSHGLPRTRERNVRRMTTTTEGMTTNHADEAGFPGSRPRSALSRRREKSPPVTKIAVSWAEGAREGARGKPR